MPPQNYPKDRQPVLTFGPAREFNMRFYCAWCEVLYGYVMHLECVTCEAISLAKACVHVYM